MDFEHIQLPPCLDHQVKVDPASVSAHVQLPQPVLPLHPDGHLLQQVAHCLKAETAPEGMNIYNQRSEAQRTDPQIMKNKNFKTPDNITENLAMLAFLSMSTPSASSS